MIDSGLRTQYFDIVTCIDALRCMHSAYAEFEDNAEERRQSQVISDDNTEVISM